MSKEANISTTKKMGEAVNSGQLEKFHEFFAPDVKDHDPAPDQGSGPEGFIKFFTQFRSAFPDLKIAVEHMTADDDSVAIAYTVTGTQDGPFQGIPATGKKVKASCSRLASASHPLIWTTPPSSPHPPQSTKFEVGLTACALLIGRPRGLS